MYPYIQTYSCLLGIVWYVHLRGCIKLHYLQFDGNPKKDCALIECDAAKIHHSLKDQSASLHTIFMILRYSLFQERECLMKGVKRMVSSHLLGWPALS